MNKVTEDFYNSIMFDKWPRMAAIVDFGLTKQNYAAYQRGIRSGEITMDKLGAAIGDGKKLTALIRAAVVTPYDMMAQEE